jgi:hypothetical protein
MPTTSQIAGIFPLGDSGEFVVAEWVPALEKIESELFAMADSFDDWSIPLNAAREAFIYSTETYFDTEHDPYGVKWVPLSQRTARYKELHGYPEDILQREGKLKKAATSEGAWFISEREVIFNSAALPPYGPIHQAGTLEEVGAGGPAHGFLHKTRSGEGTLTPEEAQSDITGKGAGHSLPQRMFIGANEGTIAEIEEAFISYINGLTDVFIGGEGVVRDPIPPLMGINKLGTFPIISMTKLGQPILRTPHGPRFGRRI